jgi:hypothetical protein
MKLYIYNYFCDIFKKTNNQLFITDFKCGYDEDLYFDFKSDINTYLDKIKSIKNGNKIVDQIKSNPLDARKLIKALFILRWNHEDMKRGYKISLLGRKILFIDCILQHTTMKLDVVAFINGSFHEFSNNYFIVINGKSNYGSNSINTKALVKELKNDCITYSHEHLYWKLLKRKFSICNQTNTNNKLLSQLVKFFNSNVGMLNFAKNELQIILTVLEAAKPKINDIVSNIQIVKQNLSSIVDINLPDNIFEYLDNITSKTNHKTIHRELTILVEQLNKIINKESFNLIQKLKIKI